MKIWPFGKNETRESGGNFSDRVIRLLESEAAGQIANANTTAALESSAGALSRAFMSAKVVGDSWAQKTLNPRVLGQIGRDLIRSGQSMHVIQVDDMGNVELLPASSWHFTGGASPSDWFVRSTVYGPSTSETHYTPYAGVVYVMFGSSPGTPYVGTSPMNFSNTSAKLYSETERSLADESSGPIAQLLPVPEATAKSDDKDVDPSAALRKDIRDARGRALTLETTAEGHGEGPQSAPRKDWVANRLGPTPPAALVQLRSDAYQAVLAATGTPPALFTDSDGTSQREAVRRWHMNLVLPLAALLEYELSEKLETPISLEFDRYPLDMVSRTQTVKGLVAAEVEVERALRIAGLSE